MAQDTPSWRKTNLGVNDINHYRKIYEQTKERNPRMADQTFRATVGRFVNADQNAAIGELLKEVKKK